MFIVHPPAAMHIPSLEADDPYHANNWKVVIGALMDTRQSETIETSREKELVGRIPSISGGNEFFG